MSSFCSLSSLSSRNSRNSGNLGNSMIMLPLLKASSLFLIAALCEISGAYLIWQWRNGGKPAWLALVGVLALFLYSLIQTVQAFSFGRAFAAYAGIFMASALVWGWWIDKRPPDHWDWLGVVICLIGVGLMLWAPRGQ